jgi:hypothetical protein
MILFVNQSKNVTQHCGVYLIGMQYSDALQTSKIHTYLRIPVNSIDQLHATITAVNPTAVIVNYHSSTMTWADVSHIKQEFASIPFIKIEHDFRQKSVDEYTPETNQGYDYAICFDQTLHHNNPRVFHINRLMAHGTFNQTITYDAPAIGYQGFGFDHKGIPLIAEQVVKEFNKAHLRFHIPNSYYGDPHGYLAQKQINEVLDIIKETEITLHFSNELMSSDKLVTWLSNNDVNCYFYHDMNDYGIASAPDYAIAAKKPIAVKQTSQLKYIWQNVPSSIIDNSSLKEIIKNGFTPFELLYNKMQRESVIGEFDMAVSEIIARHNG